MRPEPISVLMPVRNGASTLTRAVTDLVAGLGPDDELLAVDDGSDDATPILLADWSRTDARIRVVSTRGLGLVGALNLGMGEARHEWIARADADDRYPLDRLALQRRALADDVALVTGDYRLTPPGGRSTYLACALGHPFVALSLINPQRVPHPGVVIRRSAVLAAGGYRDSDFPAEDLGLWLRLTSEGMFVGVGGCVVDWSMNPGSITHSRQLQQRSRTADLLRSWRPSLLGQVTDEAVERELALYRSASHAGERTLLLLRDLRAWQGRGTQIQGRARVVRDLLRHPASSSGAAWQLARDARHRRRERADLSPRSPSS